MSPDLQHGHGRRHDSPSDLFIQLNPVCLRMPTPFAVAATSLMHVRCLRHPRLPSCQGDNRGETLYVNRAAAYNRKTSHFAGTLEATMEAWYHQCTLASPFHA